MPSLLLCCRMCATDSARKSSRLLPLLLGGGWRRAGVGGLAVAWWWWWLVRAQAQLVWEWSEQRRGAGAATPHLPPRQHGGADQGTLSCSRIEHPSLGSPHVNDWAGHTVKQAGLAPKATCNRRGKSKQVKGPSPCVSAAVCACVHAGVDVRAGAQASTRLGAPSCAGPCTFHAPCRGTMQVHHAPCTMQEPSGRAPPPGRAPPGIE